MAYALMAAALLSLGLAALVQVRAKAAPMAQRVVVRARTTRR